MKQVYSHPKELPDSWGHWIDKHGQHWWVFGHPGKLRLQPLNDDNGMPDDECGPCRITEIGGDLIGGWRKERAADCSTAQGVSALDGILPRLMALCKELTAEAQRIDSKMDADDYDGDLDADELEANTIRLCVQKLTTALETKGG